MRLLQDKARRLTSLPCIVAKYQRDVKKGLKPVISRISIAFKRKGCLFEVCL